jgi:hypothetical protein
MSTPFRYWDDPEPGPAALALLGPSDMRDRLAALLAEGDPEAIEEWLAEESIPEEVKQVLGRSLRGEEAFDAVAAAGLRWEDRTGSYTSCVVQRQGKGLVYRVWQLFDYLSQVGWGQLGQSLDLGPALGFVLVLAPPPPNVASNPGQDSTTKSPATPPPTALREALATNFSKARGASMIRTSGSGGTTMREIAPGRPRSGREPQQARSVPTSS